MTNDNRRKSLLNGDGKACVWGLGYTGFSTLCAFSSEGVKCVGFDVDQKKIKDIRDGKSPVPFFENWLRAAGVWIQPEKIMVVEKAEAIPWEEIIVHMICVPTEKAGKPFDGYLDEVLGQIEKKRSGWPLVIIESTISVRDIDRVVMKYKGSLNIASAPRRDWFVSPEKNLKTTPRVVGAFDQKTLEEAAAVLRIVSDSVYEADDLYQSSLVKVIENTLRQISIQVANELSVLFAGKTDVRRMLELAATKWNIELIRPSMGIGGYCIPVAPKYALDGAESNGTKDRAKLICASIQSMEDHREEVVRFFKQFRSVGFAGLEYKDSTAIYVLSPFAAIANRLCEEGVCVGVAPENCDAERARALVPGAEMFSFPDGMGKFDCVVVSVAHPRYRQISVSDLRAAMDGGKQTRVLIDNEAVMRNIPDSLWKEIKVKRIIPGQLGWLVCEK